MEEERTRENFPFEISRGMRHDVHSKKGMCYHQQQLNNMKNLRD